MKRAAQKRVVHLLVLAVAGIVLAAGSFTVRAATDEQPNVAQAAPPVPVRQVARPAGAADVGTRPGKQRAQAGKSKQIETRQATTTTTAVSLETQPPAAKPTRDAGAVDAGASTPPPPAGSAKTKEPGSSPRGMWMLLPYALFLFALPLILALVDIVTAYKSRKELQTLLTQFADNPEAAERIRIATASGSQGIAGLSRSTTGFMLLMILGFCVFHLAVTDPHSSYLQTILTLLGGALTSITGFYFGSKASQEGRRGQGGRREPCRACAQAGAENQGHGVAQVSRRRLHHLGHRLRRSARASLAQRRGDFLGRHQGLERSVDRLRHGFHPGRRHQDRGAPARRRLRRVHLGDEVAGRQVRVSH